MRKPAVYCIFMFLLLITVQESSAQRVIRVGYYDFNPLIFNEARDTPSGLFVDILNRLAEDKNWKITYVYRTWKDTYQGLMDGTLDLVPCIGISEARKEAVDFTEEYLYLDWGVIYSAPGKKVDTILDLDGKRVAVLSASIYTDGLKETLAQFDVRPVFVEQETYHDVFRLIEENKADAGMSTNITGLRFEREFSARRTPIFFAPTKLAFAVKKGGNGDLLAALDQEIAKQKADSRSYYYDRYHHWITSLEEKVIPLYVWISVAGLLAFLVLLGFWNNILKHQVSFKTRIFEEGIELRKQQEARLRESESRFRVMFEQAAVGVAQIDTATGRFVRINQKYCDIVGYSPEEMENLNSQTITHPDDLPLDLAQMERLKTEQIHEFSMEKRYIRKHGGIVWVMLTVSPMWAESTKPTCHIAIVQDISKRKQAERLVYENEERLRAVLEQSPIGIALSRDGIRLDANRAFLLMFGYEEVAELKGKPLLNQIAPHCRPEMRSRVEKRTQGENVENMYETFGLRKDGTEFPVLVSATIIHLPDGPATVSFYTDLTAQKQAEQERHSLQAQLAQAQKMEAIGTLAGGIAHDFNNILGAVLGYAEVAREECPSGSQVAQDLDQVILAGTRAKDLVKQILAFSRQAETEKIPLLPASIVKETIKLLRSSLPSTIDIRQNIDGQTAPILADPTQIHQILINLCTNAFHAMEERGGILTISLTNIRLTEEELAAAPHLQPGLFVRLSVSDTGGGITPEIKNRIFDPYFTTKEIGKGTGMGLAIVHGIAKSYGGFIDCDSNLGQGTTFRVTLPALKEQAISEVKTNASVPVGKERILFIDDESMLAEMSRTMLARLGYTVTVRTDSLEALNTFRQAPEAFDLVITDQTMPHMTGIELARTMLQIRPQLPIILCTGYSNLISEDKVKATGIRGFALKPLTRKNIAELIRQVLGREETDAYAK
ncbi:MAG TPA: hypothetical protein DDY32_18350 [Desulfobulbaceae bacterium]|nr:hypothetical protein [Desulfobulbaceae bacterium]